MPITLRSLKPIVWLVLVSAHPEPVPAQWFVELGIGSDRYWGGSVGSSPEQLSLRPYRPTILGAALERRSEAFGAAIRLKYTDASLGLEGGDAVVAVKSVFTVVSAAPEIEYRVLTLDGDNQLWLHAGPLLEYWSLVDEDSRIRAGGQGAVSLSLPLGGRFAMCLLASMAVIGSPFDEDDLEASYERRALWRRGILGGLRYRL
jgi:hypothetical protein